MPKNWVFKNTIVLNWNGGRNRLQEYFRIRPKSKKSIHEYPTNSIGKVK